MMSQLEYMHECLIKRVETPNIHPELQAKVAGKLLCAFVHE